jgi:hypothetical protein
MCVLLSLHRLCPPCPSDPNFSHYQASQNLMQINQGQGVDKRNFVANVLKVELFGPDLTPLSILDLPGIISAANTVKEEEKEGVKQLVVEYMKQSQNIIICVVSAHTDIDHQEILQLALRHAEPQRLVGVLTKCDKVDEPEMVSLECLVLASFACRLIPLFLFLPLRPYKSSNSRILTWRDRNATGLISL